MKAGCRLGLSAVRSSFDRRKRGRRESAGRTENNAVYGTPPWKKDVLNHSELVL